MEKIGKNPATAPSFEENSEIHDATDPKSSGCAKECLGSWEGTSPHGKAQFPPPAGPCPSLLPLTAKIPGMRALFIFHPAALAKWSSSHKVLDPWGTERAGKGRIPWFWKKGKWWWCRWSMDLGRCQRAWSHHSTRHWKNIYPELILAGRIPNIYFRDLF